MAKYKLPKTEELFEAGVHFGHQVRRWNPKMEPYIYTQRSGIHIINLEDTTRLIKNAADFLYDIATKGGQIIFVGTKRQASDIIESEAKRAGALYVTDRWLGGTITNFRVVKKNIDKLVDFIRRKEDGSLAKYTKKERLLIDREIAKLQKSVGGIVSLRGKPEALFVIDTRREKTAIKEARKVGIPVVGIVDTNCDPSLIDYVIPGNDDAIRSISLIVKVIADAVELGYKEYAKTTEDVVEVVSNENEESDTVKVTSSEASYAVKDMKEKEKVVLENNTDTSKNSK